MCRVESTQDPDHPDAKSDGTDVDEPFSPSAKATFDLDKHIPRAPLSPQSDSSPELVLLPGGDITALAGDSPILELSVSCSGGKLAVGVSPSEFIAEEGEFEENVSEETPAQTKYELSASESEDSSDDDVILHIAEDGDATARKEIDIDVESIVGTATETDGASSMAATALPQTTSEGRTKSPILEYMSFDNIAFAGATSIDSTRIAALSMNKDVVEGSLPTEAAEGICGEPAACEQSLGAEKPTHEISVSSESDNSAKYVETDMAELQQQMEATSSAMYPVQNVDIGDSPSVSDTYDSSTSQVKDGEEATSVHVAKPDGHRAAKMERMDSDVMTDESSGTIEIEKQDLSGAAITDEDTSTTPVAELLTEHGTVSNVMPEPHEAIQVQHHEAVIDNILEKCSYNEPFGLLSYDRRELEVTFSEPLAKQEESPIRPLDVVSMGRPELLRATDSIDRTESASLDSEDMEESYGDQQDLLAEEMQYEIPPSPQPPLHEEQPTFPVHEDSPSQSNIASSNPASDNVRAASHVPRLEAGPGGRWLGGRNEASLSIEDIVKTSSSSEASAEPTLLAATYELESGSISHVVTTYDISPDSVEKTLIDVTRPKAVLSSPEDDVFEYDLAEQQVADAETPEIDVMTTMQPEEPLGCEAAAAPAVLEEQMQPDMDNSPFELVSPSDFTGYDDYTITMSAQDMTRCALEQGFKDLAEQASPSDKQAEELITLDCARQQVLPLVEEESPSFEHPSPISSIEPSILHEPVSPLEMQSTEFQLEPRVECDTSDVVDESEIAISQETQAESLAYVYSNGPMEVDYCPEHDLYEAEPASEMLQPDESDAPEADVGLLVQLCVDNETVEELHEQTLSPPEQPTTEDNTMLTESIIEDLAVPGDILMSSNHTLYNFEMPAEETVFSVQPEPMCASAPVVSTSMQEHPLLQCNVGSESLEAELAESQIEEGEKEDQEEEQLEEEEEERSEGLPVQEEGAQEEPVAEGVLVTLDGTPEPELEALGDDDAATGSSSVYFAPVDVVDRFTTGVDVDDGFQLRADPNDVHRPRSPIPDDTLLLSDNESCSMHDSQDSDNASCDDGRDNDDDYHDTATVVVDDVLREAASVVSTEEGRMSPRSRLVSQISEDIPEIMITQHLHEETDEEDYPTSYAHTNYPECIAEDVECQSPADSNASSTDIDTSVQDGSNTICTSVAIEISAENAEATSSDIFQEAIFLDEATEDQALVTNLRDDSENASQSHGQDDSENVNVSEEMLLQYAEESQDVAEESSTNPFLVKGLDARQPKEFEMETEETESGENAFLGQSEISPNPFFVEGFDAQMPKETEATTTTNPFVESCFSTHVLQTELDKDSAEQAVDQDVTFNSTNPFLVKGLDARMPKELEGDHECYVDPFSLSEVERDTSQPFPTDNQDQVWEELGGQVQSGEDGMFVDMSYGAMELSTIEEERSSLGSGGSRADNSQPTTPAEPSETSLISFEPVPVDGKGTDVAPIPTISAVATASFEDCGDSSSVDSFATVVAAEADLDDSDHPEDRLADVASMTSSMTSDMQGSFQEDIPEPLICIDVRDELEETHSSDSSQLVDTPEETHAASLPHVQLHDEHDNSSSGSEKLPGSPSQRSPGVCMPAHYAGRSGERDDISVSSSLLEFEYLEGNVQERISDQALLRALSPTTVSSSELKPAYISQSQSVGEYEDRQPNADTASLCSLTEFESIEAGMQVKSSGCSSVSSLDRLGEAELEAEARKVAFLLAEHHARAQTIAHEQLVEPAGMPLDDQPLQPEDEPANLAKCPSTELISFLCDAPQPVDMDAIICQASRNVENFEEEQTGEAYVSAIDVSRRMCQAELEFAADVGDGCDDRQYKKSVAHSSQATAGIDADSLQDSESCASDSLQDPDSVLAASTESLGCGTQAGCEPTTSNVDLMKLSTDSLQQEAAMQRSLDSFGETEQHISLLMRTSLDSLESDDLTAQTNFDVPTSVPIANIASVEKSQNVMEKSIDSLDIDSLDTTDGTTMHRSIDSLNDIIGINEQVDDDGQVVEDIMQKSADSLQAGVMVKSVDSLDAFCSKPANTMTTSVDSLELEQQDVAASKSASDEMTRSTDSLEIEEKENINKSSDMIMGSGDSLECIPNERVKKSASQRSFDRDSLQDVSVTSEFMDEPKRAAMEASTESAAWSQTSSETLRSSELEHEIMRLSTDSPDSSSRPDSLQPLGNRIIEECSDHDRVTSAFVDTEGNITTHAAVVDADGNVSSTDGMNVPCATPPPREFEFGGSAHPALSPPTSPESESESAHSNNCYCAPRPAASPPSTPRRHGDRGSRHRHPAA